MTLAGKSMQKPGASSDGWMAPVGEEVVTAKAWGPTGRVSTR